MDTLTAHLIAIVTMRTSNDIEAVREMGRTFAVKYLNLVKALGQAQNEILANVSPEELATVERVFDAIARHEQANIDATVTDMLGGLDTEDEG